MTTGALIFAHNNPDVDYIKIANFAAKRVKEFLNIPVSVVTDIPEWLVSEYPNHEFDQIIKTSVVDLNKKDFYDGSLNSKNSNGRTLRDIELMM